MCIFNLIKFYFFSNNPVKVKMPKDTRLKFKNHNKSLDVPIVLYVDTEVGWIYFLFENFNLFKKLFSHIRFLRMSLKNMKNVNHSKIKMKMKMKMIILIWKI